MELLHLRLLQMIDEYGSLTEAAAAIGYSQSSVSRHLAMAETEVGRRLVNRGRNGATLTSAGLVFLRHAKGVNRHMEQAREELGLIPDDDVDTLRVAAVAGVMNHLVPQAVRRFRDRHPNVRPHLQLCETWTASSLVKEGAADISVSLLTESDLQDPDDPELPQATRLFEEELVCALPEDHPLAGQTLVPLAELADDPWIVEGAPHLPTPRALADAAARCGFTPKDGIHFEGITGVLLGLVSMGQGLALISGGLADLLFDGVVIRRLDPPPRLTATAFTSLASDSMEIQQFVEHLGQVALEISDFRAQVNLITNRIEGVAGDADGVSVRFPIVTL